LYGRVIQEVFYNKIDKRTRRTHSLSIVEPV